MTDWEKRAAYIEDQVSRGRTLFVRGLRCEAYEWLVRYQAANRWHELHGGGQL